MAVLQNFLQRLPAELRNNIYDCALLGETTPDGPSTLDGSAWAAMLRWPHLASEVSGTSSEGRTVVFNNPEDCEVVGKHATKKAKDSIKKIILHIRLEALQPPNSEQLLSLTLFPWLEEVELRAPLTILSFAEVTQIFRSVEETLVYKLWWLKTLRITNTQVCDAQQERKLHRARMLRRARMTSLRDWVLAHRREMKVLKQDRRAVEMSTMVLMAKRGNGVLMVYLGAESRLGEQQQGIVEGFGRSKIPRVGSRVMVWDAEDNTFGSVDYFGRHGP